MSEPTTATGTIAAEMASAVTGEGSPNTVTVKRPARQALWSLFVAMAGVCLMLAAVIAILAWSTWPEATAAARVKYIGWIGLVLCGTIPLIVFAVVSPWVGRVEATAGQNHFTLSAKE